MNPKITFIVSAFNRPDELLLCLQSIFLQTEKNWEAIVTDNATDPAIREKHRCIVIMFQDTRIHYQWMGAIDCYESAEMGWAIARGDWLCFPSDDSYYTPMFAEKMWRTGEPFLDLVYCDFVWGREQYWGYCEGRAQACHVDKTTFIVRRSKMFPFPDDGAYPPACDGMFVEECVRRGYRVGRMAECLVVHN